MVYVDGFVVCVPKNKLRAYKKVSLATAKIYLAHGALEYVESVGDDLKRMHDMRSFTQIAKPKKSEAVLFSWVKFKSRAHRDRVNKKVFADKRMLKLMEQDMPFDCSRMAYGGFRIFIEDGRA